MSNTKNNGGPAFPTNGEQFIEGVHGIQPQSAYGMQGHNGMSLRDYFAAKAMASMLVGRTPQELLSLYSYGADGRSKVAIDAYLFADTMLKAREQ